MHSNIKIMNSFVIKGVRLYATKSKRALKVTASPEMLKEIDEEMYKPRNHPGVMKPRIVTLPEPFLKAAEIVLEDYPLKSLKESATKLTNHLRYKKPPIERRELRKIAQKTLDDVTQKIKGIVGNEEESPQFQATLKHKMNHVLKMGVYNWKNVNYDLNNSLLYLVARAAPEYAVLVKIFAEMAKRDPNFKPRGLFDFGSGIGTVTWASLLYWQDSIFEYYNVDSSVHMNDLAQLLLQGGRGEKKMFLKGVTYRQFLPSTPIIYDLVVSAYSLMELPSRQARLETILNLWNRTGKYLVIVEQGSNAGFQIVNEARDFLLHGKYNATCHVFSPCPHDKICPRFVSTDTTPCNFVMHYNSFSIEGSSSERRQERYSYIVLAKGLRKEDDPQWPRLVREALVRSKHTICRMCTKHGKLQEVIFTSAKHGKATYYCARSSRWGDVLPVDLQESENAELSICDQTEESDSQDNNEMDLENKPEKKS